MLIDFLNHIYIVGTASSFIVALLLALVVFKSPNMQKSCLFLELILIALALSTVANSLLNMFSGKFHPTVGSFTEPFQLLFGPLFYFYVRNLREIKEAWPTIVPHFLPFFLACLFLSIYLVNRNHENPFGAYSNTIVLVLSFTVYVQLWVYYFLSMRELRQYREMLKASCSDVERMNASWVGHSLFALLCCYTALTLVYILNHHDMNLPVNKLLAIFVASLIYFVSYATLRRPQLFLAGPANAFKVKPQYAKSGLSQPEIEAIMERVTYYMDENQPYTEPELTISALAQLLDLSTHHLSQVINSGNNNSFYDFVNGYRIEAVKSKFANASYNNQTILTIAFESGFNSKATFNRIFKKTVQQTPSAYRKSLNLS